MYEIIIVAYERFQRSAFSGIREFFDLANVLSKSKYQKDLFKVVLASKDGRPVCDHLSRIAKSITNKASNITSCDAVIFLGTMASYEKDLSRAFLDKVTKDWLINQNNNNKVIAGILSGIFILAEANILSDREFALCDSHRGALLTKYPFLEDKSKSTNFFIRDENLLTGCAITSWLDISIELVKDALGNDADKLLDQLSIPRTLSKSNGIIQMSEKKETLSINSNVSFISKVVETLKKDTNVNITVKGLADLMSVSERTLSRKIKYYTSSTPKQLIDDIRIEKSWKLLKSTDKQIKEISYLCGYTNDDIFRRNFIRRTKMTPSEYREIYSNA